MLQVTEKNESFKTHTQNNVISPISTQLPVGNVLKSYTPTVNSVTFGKETGVEDNEQRNLTFICSC